MARALVPKGATFTVTAPPPLRAIGLGCMRLSTDPARDESRALETLAAGLEAGVTLLDTAPSYGLGETDQHHNERLIRRALSVFEQRKGVRVATKGGLVRVGTKWVPDGRAKSIRASCERSLDALSVSMIDLYFLHTPDLRTPWTTTVRALAALKREGWVRAIGISNVSSSQLEVAIGEAGIDAVEVSLGAFDDTSAKSGLLARAIEQGVEILAYSPLGGPKRARKLERDPVLRTIGNKLGVSGATVFLAWLYGLTPSMVPIPGASRPETARAAAIAARLELSETDRADLDKRFTGLSRVVGRVGAAPIVTTEATSEVVLVMGIQAGGKSTYVDRFVKNGYERLNRDERGGTLRKLSQQLGERLRNGGGRFVLDNTYPTRAARSHVIDAARDHGANVRCVFIDTSIERAQFNATVRLIDRHGELPAGETLKTLSKTDPHAFLPTTQWRFRRELELPSLEEGFSDVEHRVDPPLKAAWETRPGVVIASDALDEETLHTIHRDGFADAPILLFVWAGEHQGDLVRAELASKALSLGDNVQVAICEHPGGPPTCWCRPPLPGLLILWAKRLRIDLGRSLVVGSSPAHRALAKVVGARFVGRQ